MDQENIDYGTEDVNENLDDFIDIALSPIKSFQEILEQMTGPGAGDIVPEELMPALTEVYKYLIENAENRIDMAMNELHGQIGRVELTLRRDKFKTGSMPDRIVSVKTRKQ